MSELSLTTADPMAMTIGGATLVETGIVWENGLCDVERWSMVVPFLHRTAKAWKWWVGDWMAYGDQQNWGEMYDQAMSIFELDYQSLADCKWVSSRVPLVLRHRKLSWSHHKAVAKLDHAQQKYWLDQCEPLAEDQPARMTSKELTKAIQRAQKADRLGRPREEVDVLEQVQDRIGALGTALNEAQREFGRDHDRVSAVVARWFDLAGEWKEARDGIEATSRERRGDEREEEAEAAEGESSAMEL